MGFSEKMRESLGAEGARLELVAPADAVSPGHAATAKVVIRGGTRPAKIDALIVRIIEADRFWKAEDGGRITEDEAQTLDDRRHLTAGWDRRAVGQERVEVGRSVDPGEEHEVVLTAEIPAECKPTSVRCSHTLNVQADVKGQIDPTANARISVSERP